VSLRDSYQAKSEIRSPATPARPAELEVIEGMPVKSTITAPEDQAKVPLCAVTVRGFAWAPAVGRGREPGLDGIASVGRSASRIRRPARHRDDRIEPCRVDLLDAYCFIDSERDTRKEEVTS
jgi:hypothetical protein